MYDKYYKYHYYRNYMEFLNSDMSCYSNRKPDDLTKVNKRTE